MAKQRADDDRVRLDTVLNRGLESLRYDDGPIKFLVERLEFRGQIFGVVPHCGTLKGGFRNRGGWTGEPNCTPDIMLKLKMKSFAGPGEAQRRRLFETAARDELRQIGFRNPHVKVTRRSGDKYCLLITASNMDAEEILAKRANERFEKLRRED